MIELLVEGVHTNHYHEGYYDIYPHTSSVTLIRNNGHNILVDTGTPMAMPKIIEGLAKHGLAPADIDVIFNTHFHLDHCGNDVLFPNALVWIGRSNLDYKTGRARIYQDTNLIEYPAGMKPLFTPGHTLDHTAYSYEENGVRYVCGGDAVREDTIRSQRVPVYHSQEKFVPSMKLIFESSDVIIPGHGRVIQGELKKELYALVCGQWD